MNWVNSLEPVPGDSVVIEELQQQEDQHLEDSTRGHHAETREEYTPTAEFTAMK